MTNTGYWGMGVKRGEQYQLSAWIRIEDGKPGTLTAQLRSRNGKVLGSSELKGKTSKKWRHLEATITAEADDPQAEFLLRHFLDILVHPGGHAAMDIWVGPLQNQTNLHVNRFPV